MNHDIRFRYCLIIWSSLIGITFFTAAYASDYTPYRNFWANYLTFFSSTAFLASILGLLVSIYAFALPLSFSTISNKLSPYGDQKVVEWFKDKWEVYYHRIVVPFFMVYLIILLFSNINNGFGCIIVLIGSIYTIYMSWKYFRTILKISVNTELEIINWSSETINSMLE